MKTISLLSHIAIFLSGVFIALLVSTLHLSSTTTSLDDASSAKILRSASRTRGDDGASSPSSPSPNDNEKMRELQTSLKEERRKTRELQDAISQLQEKGDEEDGASSSQTTIDAHAETSAEGLLREEVLRSFDAQRERIRGADTKPAGDGICSVLPRPTPTALSLWSHHLPHVFNATEHPADHPDYVFHDFTALLQHFMTPDRLQRSVKTLPLDWTPVERGLDVVHQRLMAIRTEVDAHRKLKGMAPDDTIPEDVMRAINDNKGLPRKLNVLVMGGSVTMGVVCHVNPATTQVGKYSRRACAWPGRMSPFLSRLFGGHDLVDFHTLALGGTNTESGATVWDYSLGLSGDVPYPDVVINAYATNDMHYNSAQDAKARNVSLGQSVFALGQTFVRQLLTPKRGCGHAPPLLLYLDDYLGNEQNEVTATLMSSQTINLLSGYYGIGSMSYGDAVRDMVYGDTEEWWFSSKWYEGGKYERAVHPHMGMHISMVWVVAFNLMNLVTTYCSFPEASKLQSSSQQQQLHRRHHAGVEGKSQGAWDYGYKPIDGMLPTLRGTTELVGGPKQRPRGIPPPLTEDLSLEHITQSWREDAASDAHLWNTLDECVDLGRVSGDGDAPPPKPCIYSWVANLERHLDNPKRVRDRLRPHLSSNEGWAAADDGGKLGWVPSSGAGSKFAMEWKGVTRPVRAVTWMIMRSYGEKWEGSKLRVEVWSGATLLASENIVGYHDKKTSETYNIKMRLASDGGDGKKQEGGGGVAVGGDLRITFELIGGTTFKISGMAICDH